MIHCTENLILLAFALMLGISLSEDCHSLSGLQGKKCYDSDHKTYTCCLLHNACLNGQCVSASATPPSKSFPSDTSLIIGVGVSVLCIACLITGAIYWHRRQLRNSEKRINPLASFSQSIRASTRSGSSAGVRIRSSTSQSPSVEASVNLSVPTTAIP